MNDAFPENWQLRMACYGKNGGRYAKMKSAGLACSGKNGGRYAKMKSAGLACYGKKWRTLCKDEVCGTGLLW